MSALQDLREAVQAFANNLAAEMGDDIPLLDICVVLWEQVTYEGDDVKRQVMYTVPSDNFGIAAAIGLCEAGRVLLRRDTLSREERE